MGNVCVGPTHRAHRRALRAAFFSLVCAAGLLGSTAYAQTATPPTPSTTGPGSANPPAQQQQPGAPPANRQPAPAQKRHPWFEAHGSFFERYRDDTNRNNGGYDSREAVTYGNVVGNFNVSQNYTLYARLGGEGLTARGQGRDFNTNYYTGNAGFRGAFALDQFGAIYHNAATGLTITLGRQDKPLDLTGTAYDLSYRVGLHTFLDGVSLIKKVGDGTVEGYVFSEDQYQTVAGRGRATRNGLYALRGTTGLSKTFILGGTLGRFQSSAVSRQAGINTTGNYEIDAQVQPVQFLQIKAEFGQSNSRSEHDLYYLSGRLALTKQDSFTTYSYRIAPNADFGHDSGYPNGYRGTRYFVEHDFDKSVSLIVYHETNRQLYGSGAGTSDQVTVAYTF